MVVAAIFISSSKKMFQNFPKKKWIRKNRKIKPPTYEAVIQAQQTIPLVTVYSEAVNCI